jgi:hypothetical protein
MKRVTQAMEACRREHLASAEAVIQRTQSLAAIEIAQRDGTATSSDEAAAPRIDVPLPNLSRFDQLLCSPADNPVSVIFA